MVLLYVDKANERRLKSGFAPNYVHSFDACLLKTAFQQCEKPLVTIHDCIGVLPNDMDDAHERIRRAMVHICQGDPLARLASNIKASSRKLKPMQQGNVDLLKIQGSRYMFH